MKRFCIYFMIAALLISMTGLTGCGDDEGPEYDDYEDEALEDEYEDGDDDWLADDGGQAGGAGQADEGGPLHAGRQGHRKAHDPKARTEGLRFHGRKRELDDLCLPVRYGFGVQVVPGRKRYERPQGDDGGHCEFAGSVCDPDRGD